MTARALAVQALMRQESGGYANLVLDAELQKNPLEPREKAFAGAVFYTTTEHLYTLDYILSQYLKKGTAGLDAAVRAILRSALAQVRYMDVPASAAVNEAVKLTRSFKKSSASGLVNAVLRKAIAYDGDLTAEQFSTPAQRLSVVYSVSVPVAEALLQWYPQEAEGILNAASKKNKTALRVNVLRTNAENLKNALQAEGAEEVENGSFPGCVLAKLPGSPAQSKAFRHGFYHVEGQLSQLAALAVQAKPGETIVDLCAAPGGKTLTIAQEMGDKGTLFSCDVTANRTSLIEKAVERMALHCVTVLQNDAAMPNPKLQGFDRVLADVPCSGLGILGKKPDIRYKALDTLPELVALQRKILENAASMLRDGGRLVYSTCTVNPEENERQIECFLKKHPEFSLAEPLPRKWLPQGITDTGFGLVSLPARTGLDGFFICAMEKKRNG